MVKLIPPKDGGYEIMDNIDNMHNLVPAYDGGFRQKTADIRFATTSIFTKDAFWLVSADTKMCGSPQNWRLLAVYVCPMTNIRLF